MVIIFYRNLSDKRYLNKNLTTITTSSNAVLLDDSVNMTAPHFRVTGVTLNTVNYCYVMDFKRYYYITDVEVLHGGVCNITCAVDVLMSFKNDILNCSGIMERTAINGNVLITDSNYNVNRVDDTLTNLAFTGCEFLKNTSANNNSFLLVTFGGTALEGGS